MTTALAHLLNILPPRLSYLFPDAVVLEASLILLKKMKRVTIMGDYSHPNE